MPFQVGDVVIVNSGGPYMTVRNNNRADGCVYCEWFVEGVEVKGHAFPPQMLTLVPRE